MKFSPRFELIHLLGGKCVRCPQENMSELEIDHIYNDGDADRANHTEVYKRWLQMPILAKKRLQVLCKSCHEDKHNGFDSLESKKESEEELRQHQERMRGREIVVQTLKKLEGNFKKPINLDLLLENLEPYHSIDTEEWKLTITRCLRECSIYESRPRCYNVV